MPPPWCGSADVGNSTDASTAGLEHQVPVAPLTTMRVGGEAATMVTAHTQEQVIEAISRADREDTPLLVLGGGSNVVLTDNGFDGTVVRICTRGTQVQAASACAGVTVRVQAGHPWDEFVAEAVGAGWAGVEALSGIPGSTGATPVQNVGAYGQEVSQTIAQVRVWDRDAGQVRTLFPTDLDFSYRHSRLKEGMRAGSISPRQIVLDVDFQLHSSSLSGPVAYGDLAAGLGVAVGDRVPLADARRAVLEQRRRRGMVLHESDHDTWSCGSFFTNPILTPEQFSELSERVAQRLGDDVHPPNFAAPEGRIKTSAAWLIERAGFGKGHGSGGRASLSTKHTLAVTNRGDATAEDVLALAREVRDGVQEAFGVALVNEPVLVGLQL